MRISLLMIVYVLLLMIVPLVVVTYVYQDARKRGMHAVLWTLVALLLPMLIGFVIYLLARVGHSDSRCSKCGALVKEAYVVCPQCGIKLKPSCSCCDRAVESDWKVCPYCAKLLPEQQADVSEPVRRKDKSLKVILGIVVAMPIVLLLLLGAYLVGGDITGSMNTTYWEIDQYLEQKQDVQIEEWIRQCQEKALKDKEMTAYVLEHETEYGGERLTQFLVYLPVNEDNLKIETDRHGTLFGGVLQVHFLTTAEEDRSGYVLCTVSCMRDKIHRIQVFRNAMKLDCEVTEVDYNLTMFEIVPQ